jgi:hypothetical protein
MAKWPALWWGRDDHHDHDGNLMMDNHLNVGFAHRP